VTRGGRKQLGLTLTLAHVAHAAAYTYHVADTVKGEWWCQSRRVASLVIVFNIPHIIQLTPQKPQKLSAERNEVVWVGGWVRVVCVLTRKKLCGDQ